MEVMDSQYAVNKREIQSKSQAKYVSNMSGTERKLVYRQKNKSYMEDKKKADVNMKKL